MCSSSPLVDTGFAARAGMRLTGAESAATVAEAALRSLGRRGEVVPGPRAKALTAALKTLPRRLRPRLMHRVMQTMLPG